MAIRSPAAWLSAEQARLRLDVKLTTLYAYASRGLITSVPAPNGRGRWYAQEDVERLRARHAARSGHGAVAAGALRFGEPVLDTRISEVTPRGPSYRGQLAIELCRQQVGFERVAELLWTGSLPPTPSVPTLELACDTAQLWPLLKGRSTLPKMVLLLGALAIEDVNRHGAADAAEFARMRALFHWLARAPEKRPARSTPTKTQPVVATLLTALRAPNAPEARRMLDQALVLCAEHELNASTFAARIAASAGADLYACLGAALNTLSGSAHGGMCDRVEALITNIGTKARAARVINELLARGEPVPGFGHPLYPDGDPRGAYLLELARQHGAHGDPARVAFALIEAMQRGGRSGPTLDVGLVTLCHCLELPLGSAATVFALGRSAGWAAHALEQRSAGYLLRPRARYFGPAPPA